MTRPHHVTISSSSVFGSTRSAYRKVCTEYILLARGSAVTLNPGGNHGDQDVRPAPRHRDRRRPAAQRRLLPADPGPAAGEEHPELRRPGPLPPLLRRQRRQAGLADDLLPLARRAERPPRHRPG